MIKIGSRLRSSEGNIDDFECFERFIVFCLTGHAQLTELKHLSPTWWVLLELRSGGLTISQDPRAEGLETKRTVATADWIANVRLKSILYIV